MEPSPARFSRIRRTLALVVFGGLGVTLFVARRGTRRASPPPAPAVAVAAPSGGCRFAPGDLRAWEITERFAQGDREIGRLSAVLTVRATAVDAATSRIHLAAQLTSVQATEAGLRERLASMRAVPFALRMQPDCAVAEVGFAADTDPLRAQTVRGLVWAFDVTMPTGEVPPHWIALQREGPGDVSVRFARSDAGDFVRQRLRFVRGGSRASDGAMPEIVRSSARFRMADDGRWLAGLVGEEVARVLPGEGGEGATLHTALTLRAVEASWTGVPPTTADLAVMDFTQHPLAATEAEAANDPAVSLALEPAVEHLGALFDARQNGAASEATAFLVAYLRAHPERAVALLQWIRRRAYPERLGALTFFAMSKVRDPRVRAALADVADDPGYPSGDRVRAAFALADNDSADVESVARLARVAQGASASPDDEVARDGALNAIGTLRGRATGEVAEAAGRVLREALDGARTPEAQGDALDAISNARDRAFLPDAREALASPSTRVRERAAGALATMDDASVESLLCDRLRVEADPAVSVSLVQAILVRTGRRPSAEAVEVAAARLPRDESVELRLALVELLGAAAAWNGAAREALARWFPAETEARVQAAIGRYLPAELLVPARRG